MQMALLNPDRLRVQKRSLSRCFNGTGTASQPSVRTLSDPRGMDSFKVKSMPPILRVDDLTKDAASESPSGTRHWITVVDRLPTRIVYPHLEERNPIPISKVSNLQSITSFAGYSESYWCCEQHDKSVSCGWSQNHRRYVGFSLFRPVSRAWFKYL